MIEPGVAGPVPPGETARLTIGEDPQELFAFTLMFPAIIPAVTLMEFVVEFPVHPEGKAQV